MENVEQTESLRSLCGFQIANLFGTDMYMATGGVVKCLCFKATIVPSVFDAHGKSGDWYMAKYSVMVTIVCILYLHNYVRARAVR